MERKMENEMETREYIRVMLGLHGNNGKRDWKLLYYRFRNWGCACVCCPVKNHSSVCSTVVRAVEASITMPATLGFRV